MTVSITNSCKVLSTFTFIVGFGWFFEFGRRGTRALLTQLANLLEFWPSKIKENRAEVSSYRSHVRSIVDNFLFSKSFSIGYIKIYKISKNRGGEKVRREVNCDVSDANCKLKRKENIPKRVKAKGNRCQRAGERIFEQWHEILSLKHTKHIRTL